MTRLSDPYQGPGAVSQGAKEGSEMARLSDPYQGPEPVSPRPKEGCQRWSS